MSLKYTFRHLFYGKREHKNRLYSLLEDLDARITTIEDGDDSSSSSYDDTEIQEKVSSLETAVGDSDSGLVKSVGDLESAIGDEDTANTILYRLKALEDAE